MPVYRLQLCSFLFEVFRWVGQQKSKSLPQSAMHAVWFNIWWSQTKFKVKTQMWDRASQALPAGALIASTVFCWRQRHYSPLWFQCVFCKDQQCKLARLLYKSASVTSMQASSPHQHRQEAKVEQLALPSTCWRLFRCPFLVACCKTTHALLLQRLKMDRDQIRSNLATAALKNGEWLELHTCKTQAVSVHSNTCSNKLYRASFWTTHSWIDNLFSWKPAIEWACSSMSDSRQVWCWFDDPLMGSLQHAVKAVVLSEGMKIQRMCWHAPLA